VTLWDACGNRLLVVVEPATDDELLTRSARARDCFHHGERIADGIAWFAPRDGSFRTAFFNPDGSLERLCGNSLLIAAAVLAKEGPVVVCPFDHAPIRVSFGEWVEASARVPITSVHHEPHSKGPVLDTGSPHLVIAHDEVEGLELATFARPLVEALGVNVTTYALRGEVASVRTFERGVNAETRACGTGAIAVALAVGHPVEIRYPGGSYRATAARNGAHVDWRLLTDAAHVVAVRAP
jgi:diaminopimelate epimerase